jgi:hypothetical protein
MKPAEVLRELLLVLWGMDQFPESRSIVFNDALPGDFSAVLVMLAVRVDIEGRVCEEETVGVCGPVVAGPHGRCVSVASMTDYSRKVPMREEGKVFERASWY